MVPRALDRAHGNVENAAAAGDLAQGTVPQTPALGPPAGLLTLRIALVPLEPGTKP